MTQELSPTLSEDANANLPETGTETTVNPTDETAGKSDVAYKDGVPEGFVKGERFEESRREALRLLEENQKYAKQLEELTKQKETDTGATYSNNSEPLYPGFDSLSEEEQKKANELALEALNKWLLNNGREPVTIEQAFSADRQVDLY
jgi:hypothetical protein